MVNASGDTLQQIMVSRRRDRNDRGYLFGRSTTTGIQEINTSDLRDRRHDAGHDRLRSSGGLVSLAGGTFSELLQVISRFRLNDDERGVPLLILL
ncbi:MAG: hypothetical protein R3E68_06620 [Burkholderiaceae bacterium]